MQVMFFADDGFLRPMVHGRLMQFIPNALNPPFALLWEHFKQAVLANMRGAGQIPKLDYDETDDAQSMATFESGDGKRWLETKLADKLISGVDDTDIGRDTSMSTP